MKETNKKYISDAAGGDAPFKGYTMEELRYQRAMMALRKEFCKTKVQQSARRLRPGSDRKQKAGSGSGLALAGRVASTLFSHMNTMDYILMGISLFGTAKKGYRLIRGKK